MGVSISDLSKYVYGSLGDGPNKFTVYLRKIDTASISASQSESTVISESKQEQQPKQRSIDERKRK